MNTNQTLRIGIDIGGTFTDFVVYHPESGEIRTFKLLSTPQDPAEAVLKGFASLAEAESPIDPAVDVIHGSTVATNALLERKGAPAALVTTRGFGDILQIGRQDRPELYDLSADPPPPLIPAERRFEVDERVDRNGDVLRALDPRQVDALVPELLTAGVDSVAVCCLFSFLYPNHEKEIAERLRAAGFLVSASCEVLPEYREYERMSTTAVNATVSPVFDRYLARLEGGLGSDGGRVNLRIMQSNGGVISVREARRFGVRCILSGPAGGVVGAGYVAGLSEPNFPTGGDLEPGLRVITFDMGGTSTDVSLIDGAPKITSEAQVGGCPIRVPVLDIHTIGAGGGSIAHLDLGGALRVGPQSAGADPGPACYGKGDLPTVTDANLVLGRLAPDQFLGGEMPLDAGRARDVLARLGEAMNLDSLAAALGVVEVANAHMERALRVISVERGHDPRRFCLLSFGGAGGLHAAELARRLGVPYVLVPPLASTLSAFGMLAADVVKDYSQTVMLPGEISAAEVAARLDPLAERGAREVQAEGVAPENVTVNQYLDMRYRGQSYELTVPFSRNFASDFHQTHRQTYGYARPEAPLEIVNVRLRAVGRVKSPQLSRQPDGGSDPKTALFDERDVVFPSGALRLPFYRGEALQSGNRFPGPAVVVRSDTTVLVPPHDQACVDPYGNLLITIGRT